MTAFHGPHSRPRSTVRWELNPAWTPWRATRAERWPSLFPHWKRWRGYYAELTAIGSMKRYIYATDEELARIKLEESFGQEKDPLPERAQL